MELVKKYETQGLQLCWIKIKNLYLGTVLVKRFLVAVDLLDVGFNIW